MPQSRILKNEDDYIKANYEFEIKDSRPTWEETYFEIAKVAAKRSKDTHTKVGACLVKDGRVIGIGYNGEPRNYNYKFNWNTEEKYDYAIHAEINAIANACSIGANVYDSVIYLTLSPCSECIKLLIQFGIKEVHFLEKYKDYDKMSKIASFSKIKLIKK